MPRTVFTDRDRRLALGGAITITPRRGWLRRFFNRLFRSEKP